jgi:hypothetical protein
MLLKEVRMLLKEVRLGVYGEEIEELLTPVETL